jgi:tocopherol O-methyltransferase
MISVPTVRKEKIRSHYDVATPFYLLFWGRHIHHGLWEGSESSWQAQQQLTEVLAREAGIHSGQRVLDVGCGMGGSSIFLAKERGCRVDGVTLSRVQRAWASAAAIRQGVGSRTKFHCADAESIRFDPKTFDVVWSVECTEHLFDKPAFFQRVGQWVRPGGRVAICAWQSGEGLNAEQEKLTSKVCDAFLCPSMGDRADYEKWFTEAGLKVDHYYDWTSRVMQTWEICIRRVRRTGIHWVARLFDRYQANFLDNFKTILDAYRTGAMVYGTWICSRPE